MNQKPSDATPRAVLREHAEQANAAELAALERLDERQRPTGWRLSPWAVVAFIVGGVLGHGHHPQVHR